MKVYEMVEYAADFNLAIGETPLIFYKRISKLMKIQLYVKRDDLYPLTGGGNKARKMQYIFNNARFKGSNAIVTAGGIQSNHVRVAALMAAANGWPSIMIIHAEKPKQDTLRGNLKLTALTGAELRFVEMKDVAAAMDDAMDDLFQKGRTPFYIWGGGHCVEGSYAYYQAVKELKEQFGENKPDYILVASGTGTTQAGIEIGTRHFFPECQVIGVSIARKNERGGEVILTSMRELDDYLNNPVSLPDNIHFDDSYIGNGYETTYPELIETIRWAARTEGLILDPTYTGKAFHALRQYVQNGIIPQGAKVLFWHTGGLLNLMASESI